MAHRSWRMGKASPVWAGLFCWAMGHGPCAVLPASHRHDAPEDEADGFAEGGEGAGVAGLGDRIGARRRISHHALAREKLFHPKEMIGVADGDDRMPVVGSEDGGHALGGFGG